MSFVRSFTSLSLLLVAPVAPGSETPASTAHEEPIALDQLVVTGSAFAKAQADLAQSSAVIAERALTIRQSNSLGETLSGEAGLAATYFGPGASRPVIRGIGGDRVRVLENSLGTFDVSQVSPDHATSVEPLFIERIEIVRGPATLLHGNAAIGGAVNVLDGRVPSEPASAAVGGKLEARFGGAADERAGAVLLRGGSSNLAWQARAFRRETDDVAIPRFNLHAHDEDETGGAADDEHRAEGSIPNTWLTTHGGSFGASWFGGFGRVGAAFTAYNSHYGVPPGAHEHEEEEAEEATAGSRQLAAVAPRAMHEDEFVRIRLQQRRLDLAGAIERPLGIFTRTEFEAGFGDYAHTEFEGGVAGTRFTQTAREARMQLPHSGSGDVAGALGFQYQFSDLAAQGDEAFLPPVKTTNWAAFLSEEIAVGRVTLQGGARLERQRVAPHAESGIAARRFTPSSLSLGAVWAVDDQWGVAVHAAQTRRAPNATELFADGPHAGTSAYEIGDASLGTERARSVEFSVRKRAGFVTGSATVFTNRFDNYILEEATGIERDGLAEYRFAARAVKFEGYEIDTWWHLHERTGRGLDLRLATDFVRAAERATGTPLPRIPSRRVMSALRFAQGSFVASIDVARSFAQQRVAANEAPSDGYTLVGADVSWKFGSAVDRRTASPATASDRGGVEWLLFLRGTNLTDAEARNHVSFLKEFAPLPGRGVAAGLRAAF